MTGRGWITGSDIHSKPYDTEEARDNFDRIFKHGKYDKTKIENNHPFKCSRKDHAHLQPK